MKIKLKVKLIEDILCLVANDQVVVDGELVESTGDWYARDIDVWYCGEIAEKIEIYKDDDHDEPELIDAITED